MTAATPYPSVGARVSRNVQNRAKKRAIDLGMTYGQYLTYLINKDLERLAEEANLKEVANDA